MRSASLNEAEQKNELLASSLLDEDQARSSTYAILAGLLSDVPNQDLMDYLSHIPAVEANQTPLEKSAGELGEAWQHLKVLAEDTSNEDIDDEYHALFIGVGRGEVIPFGSWHMTGFLMDKPLGELRQDLQQLGFEPDPNLKEPEDHIAAICETMSILITAEDIEGYQQRRFYMQHLLPWGEKFFKELGSAKSSNFYRGVGLLGERFLRFENQYLNIQEH